LNPKSLIINKEYDPVILQTVVKRYWWWPVLFVGLFFGMAFLFLRYTKPVYESSLVLQIDNQDLSQELIDVENINNKEGDISSEVELMRSQFLFERAIQRINYNVSLYAKGQVLTEEKYNSSSFNIQPYALKDSSLINVPISVKFDDKHVHLGYSANGEYYEVKGRLNEHLINDHFDLVVKSPNPGEFSSDSEENELFFVFNSVNTFAARYLSSLQVFPLDPVAKTVQISFKSNNPQLCHDVTLAVAETFFKYDEEMKRKGSENILNFIDQQLDSLIAELKNSKDSLMQYQRSSNLPDPEMAGTSISGNISALQDALFTIEDEIRSLNAVSRKLQNEPNRLDVYRLLPEMLGKTYEQALSVQINSLHDLLEKKEDLLFQVTDENSEIKALNSRIQSKLNGIRKSIATILDRLFANSASIREKIAQNEMEFFELPEKKMEFSRLKNIQELNEKYFTLFTEKKVLISISDAGFASNNRILNRPTVNTTPVSPNRKLIYTTFIMFGVVLGLAVMFFRYLTFNEINMVDDLQRLLPEKATILGGVPLFKAEMDFSQLVVGDSPKSMMAESLRKIRTNLSYINPNYKTIAITSSISGEGKTFVALNLAGIIALSGKKTILLDLDLRKPKIHLGLNADNSKGMSGLIVGQYGLDECIQHSSIENLDFITAGVIPPNPSELLLSDQFKELVEELKKSYQVIIIDNPPVGLVSDGIKNLTEADIPIYIFKSHYSKRVFAHRLRELFEMQKLERLNVILNGIQPTNSSIYGYGYGYGYGYYEVDKQGAKEAIIARIKKILSRIFNRNKG
jgi:capsular exopolysaccharide synthesis family protein